jgi:hypothetical protein
MVGGEVGGLYVSLGCPLGKAGRIVNEASIIPRLKALGECMMSDCILDMRCCTFALSRVHEPGSRHRDGSKWPDQMRMPGGAATPRRFVWRRCFSVVYCEDCPVEVGEGTDSPITASSGYCEPFHTGSKDSTACYSSRRSVRGVPAAVV